MTYLTSSLNSFCCSSIPFKIHDKPISLINFPLMLHLDTLTIRTNPLRQNSHSLNNVGGGNIVSKWAFRPTACNSLKEQHGDILGCFFLSLICYCLFSQELGANSVTSPCSQQLQQSSDVLLSLGAVISGVYTVLPAKKKKRRKANKKP